MPPFHGGADAARSVGDFQQRLIAEIRLQAACEHLAEKMGSGFSQEKMSADLADLNQQQHLLNKTHAKFQAHLRAYKARHRHDKIQLLPPAR